MDKVLEFADKYEMIKTGDHVICAVSGGADSMCLLSLLEKMSYKRGFELSALHFNHKLRGQSSDSDESFVVEYCAKNNITVYTGSGNVAEYAQSKGIGTEEAARELRYAFFEEIAEKVGADRVATAHNADDNFETIIMNMARGSGLKGICGIPPVRGRYIRPLLNTTRADIENYLEENNIPHINDESNYKPIYTRNKIRLNIIPKLVEIYPGLIKTIASNSELLRTDEDYLSRDAEKFFLKSKISEDMVRINACELKTLHLSISSRVIRRTASAFNISLSETQINDILTLSASNNPSGMLSLPEKLRVYREYDELVFSVNVEKNERFNEKRLSFNQWTRVEELGIEFYLGDFNKSEIIYTSFNTFFFKKDMICGNIAIRPRRSGDKIELHGRKGTKTLKKLFIELKIPKAKREKIPVICDESDVIALPGIGISSKHISENREGSIIIAYRSIS